MKILLPLSNFLKWHGNLHVLGTIPRSIAFSPKIHRCSSGNEVVALATQMSWQCATIPGSTAFWRGDFQEKIPNLLLFCSSHSQCIFKTHRLILCGRQKQISDCLEKSLIHFLKLETCWFELSKTGVFEAPYKEKNWKYLLNHQQTKSLCFAWEGHTVLTFKIKYLLLNYKILLLKIKQLQTVESCIIIITCILQWFYLRFIGC